MNKFIFFALAALVAVAAAASVENLGEEASQAADENETKGLSADKGLFKDFCLDTRNEVRKYLMDKANSGAAKLFNMMIETAGDVSSSIRAANAQAVEDGTKMIEADARQMKSAVTGVFSAISQAGRAKVVEIFDFVKEALNKDTVQEIANEACGHVTMDLKQKIDSNFSQYKRYLKNDPKNAEFAGVIAKTRLENLGCLTTARLTKVATGCNMIRTLAPALMDFMGL